MASSSVLREFLVKISFAKDEPKFRDFRDSMEKISRGALELTKSFVALGKATAVGATATGFAIHKLAEGLTGLYYSAQKTGSSAKAISQLQFAFQQVGLSAEAARASVEALANARRDQPGLDKALKIDTTDSTLAFMELIKRWKAENPALRSREASMAGLDPGVINQIELNSGSFAEAFQQRARMFQQEGFDPDKAAEKAKDFDRKWNEAKERWEDIGKQLAIKLLPYAERFARALVKVADGFESIDKSTGGLSTKLLAIGSALLPVALALAKFGGMSLLKNGVGLMRGGLFGAAGEAGGLAGGGAVAGEAAGSSGLLAMIMPFLPFVVAAAAIAAIAWAVTHPAQVRKAIAWTEEKAKQLAHAAMGELHALPGQLKSLGHALATVPGKMHASIDKIAALPEQFEWVKSVARGVDNLADMTKHFEGFRSTIYKDIAGKLTWGYGHLVRPGETLASLMKEGPASVLMRDLASASASVSRLVKVHLSGNQMKALSDFVFNLGEKSFAGSTLLRKLNAGDFAGAAAEFEHWNKARVNGQLQTVSGLTARRMWEAQVFRTPDKSPSISQRTEINVTGSDPHAIGREVARRQNEVNSRIVRNLRGTFDTP